MDAESLRSDPRMAGRVTRYHTWPRLKEQSVGEHTWQLLRILDCVWPEMPVQVWRAVLWHDVGEIATGDMPYPVKRNNAILGDEMDRLEQEAIRATLGKWRPDGRMPSMLDSERTIVKTCELVEMWEWGLEEAAMGSRFGTIVAERCQPAAYEMCRKIEEETVRFRLFQYMARREQEWS